MKYTTIKDTIKICRRAGITCALWGHAGIGKSELVKQSAVDDDGLPIGLIDYRCSQIESVDLRGLPDRHEGRTIYLPPEELPIGGKSSKEIQAELNRIKDQTARRIREIQLQREYDDGILFLDEANRATDDVLQSLFQLILDRRIGMYTLPPGWSVVLACNFMDGDYITNAFTDSAFLDRLCHIEVIMDEDVIPEWCNYMTSKHGEYSDKIVRFCTSNMANLVGKRSGNMGFEIQPSPRSWDRVASIEKACIELQSSREARELAIRGMVGASAAITYDQFQCPINLRDLLANGVDKHHKSLLNNMTRNELLGLSWGLVSIVSGKLNDERVIDVCLDVLEIVNNRFGDRDIGVGLCRALLSSLSDNWAGCLTNRNLLKHLTSITDNPFLNKLSQRKQLYDDLSLTAWGPKNA